MPPNATVRAGRCPDIRWVPDAGPRARTGSRQGCGESLPADQSTRYKHLIRKRHCLSFHGSSNAAIDPQISLHVLSFLFEWNRTRRKTLHPGCVCSVFLSGWPVLWLPYPARKLFEMCTAIPSKWFSFLGLWHKMIQVRVKCRWCTEDKMWLLSGCLFWLEVVGVRWHVVGSGPGPRAAVTPAAPGVASVPPSATSVSPCPGGRLQRGVAGWAPCSEQGLTEKNCPSWKQEGPPGEKKCFLRNLTSTYQLYHYEMYPLKTKSLDAFSFWGKKGAFYCIKQRLMYFDIPLFELPSLADRSSDILDFGCSVCVEREGPGKAPPSALGKKRNILVWVTV